MTALRVRGLRIALGGRALVDGIDLEVHAGECVAVVGESGAGKSVTAQSLLGLVPRGAELTADELVIDGVDARGLSARAWRRLRGARIALVSQDALVSLDPLRRVGAEVVEAAEIHDRLGGGSRRRRRMVDLLASVAVPDPERRARQYAHQLSGGLRQRALIAAALSARPAVLIADEPTTALDATVQARVLALLRSIVDDGTAMVFVSHDMGAVRRMADRVVVVRDGRVVESGTTDEVFREPRHPYTRELLAASNTSGRPLRDPEDVVLRVEAVSKAYDRPAVIDAGFDLRRGTTLGVVGESGAGKTTLARMILGVEQPDSGTLTWTAGLSPRDVQFVHQNPYGAFDPRWSISRSLHEALEAGGVPRGERADRAIALLDEVGLDRELGARRPRALSGGQRQRAAIARALARSPEVLVLDEPVSALDVTVRRRILDLLDDLQRRRGMTMVLVSHDLGVVRAVADDVLVLKDGRIVESGPVAEVFTAPRHAFTRELIEASR